MDWINKVLSRWLYAVPFAIFGLMHFGAGSDMAEMVPGFIPGGVFWIYVTGLALLLAGISIIIQKQTRLACNLLALMLLIFVLTIHLPGIIGAESDQAMQLSMSSLLKDTALAGAALFIGGKYNGDSEESE